MSLNVAKPHEIIVNLNRQKNSSSIYIKVALKLRFYTI